MVPLNAPITSETCVEAGQGVRPESMPLHATPFTFFEPIYQNVNSDAVLSSFGENSPCWVKTRSKKKASHPPEFFQIKAVIPASKSQANDTSNGGAD